MPDLLGTLGASIGVALALRWRRRRPPPRPPGRRFRRSINLGWYDRRRMRPLYDSLPRNGERFSLGDGFTRHEWEALNELARRDGRRLECVGYSGLLDYELLPPDPQRRTGVQNDPFGQGAAG